MKGLWLLPSRRRFTKLRIFFEAAMENGMTMPGVVLVQKDELAEMKAIYDNIKMPANWSILATNADGLADKCREVWPAVSKLDWVGLGCDDLRPQTPGWDKTLVEAVNGKNMVSCNDGTQGGLRMAGITVFSGGLLRAMGYMFPPHFWHTYVDNVWEDIGREVPCWTYVDSVLIKHDHPFVSQVAVDPDETHLKSYGQQERDIAAYKQWIATEKDAVIARIKAL